MLAPDCPPFGESGGAGGYARVVQVSRKDGRVRARDTSFVARNPWEGEIPGRQPQALVRPLLP